MRSFYIKLFIALLSLLSLMPQTASSQKNYINLVDTEGDTIKIDGLKLRYNGNTRPGSELTINGTAVKVYPNGAFASFLEYKPGLNKVDLISSSPAFGTAKKTIWVYCIIPKPEKSTESFRIDYVKLVPDQDQWLATGDIVTIKVKAQSGNVVTVLGKKLEELPQNLTGGVTGIYQGQYQISQSDTLKPSRIEALMTGKDGHYFKATSTSRLSANDRFIDNYALTTGKKPAIYMGLGADRLGGAKFGYIDTAVVVKITGRTGEMYRLKLSENNIAWIDTSKVRLLPAGFAVPSNLVTGNFIVSGDDDFDYVKISLPVRLPYTSNMETEPNRIELDLYGITSNTNWITQLNSATEVKNIYYRQIASDVFRVIIELNHNQPWGYSVYYDNRQLVVKIKHQPAGLRLSDMTIALDAGHGGSGLGAVGSTGLYEKDINLLLVMKLKKALEKRGAKVILTRSDDSDISITDRWIALVPQNPDILLSIHNNSIGNSDPMASKGVSTYYKYIGFRPLSECIYNELLKCGLSEYGNVGSFNFTFNGPTEFVNALLELTFMSNPEDEMKLTDSRFQDKMINQIVVGIEDFLKNSCR